MKRLLWILVVLGVFTFASGVISAQDGPPPLPGELVVDGLGAPRGIAFDDNGALYIADAGFGGETAYEMMGPEGATVAQIGLTGAVVTVDAEGVVGQAVGALPSYNMGQETIGVYRAIPRGDSLWLLISGFGPGSIGAFWGDTLVELDAATLVPLNVINTSGYELANDPDGNGYDSNIADVAWAADGTMYIVNAGMNALLSWTEADGLQTVVAWSENSVPTSIEIAENGDIYIGFLGEAIAPGAGKIEHWSGGELVETFGGLTGVTDILLDGDTLYAVQLFVFGAEGPGPGSVVSVTADGAAPVVEGLPVPFALAMGPDGALYVSFGTIPMVPGVTGGVLRVAMD
jgi:hypothetical protein